MESLTCVHLDEMPANPPPAQPPFFDRLAVKVALAAVLFLFALVTAAILIVNYSLRRTQFEAYALSEEAASAQAEAALARDAASEASLLAAHLQAAVAPVAQAGALLGELPSPTGTLEEQIPMLLPELLRRTPDLEGVYFLSPSGFSSLAAAPGFGDNLPALTPDSPIYQESTPEINPLGGIVWQAAEGQLLASVPLTVGNQFQGVLVAALPLAHVAEHLQALQPFPEGLALLAAPGGEVLASAGELPPGEAETPALERLLRTTSPAPGEVQPVSLGDTPAVLARAPLGGLPWELALLVPQETLYGGGAAQAADAIWDSTDSLIGTTMLVLLGLLLAGGVGMVFLLNRLLSPKIAAIGRGVQAVAAGNLDVQVPVSGQDELDGLAASFNTMAAELKRRGADLQQRSADLQRSEELYRTLARNFPNGAVLLFDRELRHTLADGAGLEDWGLTPAEVQSRTLAGVFPEEVATLLEPHYRAALLGEESAIELPRGEQVHLVWVLPTRNEDGAIFGGLVMTQDITERARAQQLLEQRVEESTRELSQLYERADARSRELEALYRADEQLYRHLRLDQVLQALVDVVVDELQADKAAVHVWEEARGHLVVRAARNYGPVALERLAAYRPGDGVAGKVFQSGEALAVEDARTAPYPANEIAAAEGICSVLSVPILVSGQPFGVFGMNYTRPRIFSPDDLRLFQALAQRAAIALENARLYEQLEASATQEERQRLARELHDSVTQSLYSLVLLSEAGRRHAAQGSLEQVEHHLERLGETAQQALKEMRLLVYELRPLALQEVGLVGALQQRLNAVEKRAGLQARLLVEGQINLTPPMEEGFYRIAQEALNNALKHAHARELAIILRRLPGFTELEIRDDGQGFDPGEAGGGGFGLHSMQERARKLGASMEIHSAPGSGTTVRLRAPAAELPAAANLSHEVLP